MVASPGVTRPHPIGVIHPRRVTTPHPAAAHRRHRDDERRGAGAHNAAIMSVLFLVVGFNPVGDGIAVLS